MAKPAASTPTTGDASTVDAATRAAAKLSEAWTTLTPDGRKARYGVAYVRSICAQAGVNLQETSPDEDVLAVDCDIKFSGGGAHFQCTSEVHERAENKRS